MDRKEVARHIVLESSVGSGENDNRKTCKNIFFAVFEVLAVHGVTISVKSGKSPSRLQGSIIDNAICKMRGREEGEDRKDFLAHIAAGQ